MSRTWMIGLLVGAAGLAVLTAVWILVGNEAQRRARIRAVVPWVLVAVIGSQVAALLYHHINVERAGETIVWRSPRAGWLAVGGLLVGVIAFTCSAGAPRRSATRRSDSCMRVGSVRGCRIFPRCSACSRSRASRWA